MFDFIISEARMLRANSAKYVLDDDDLGIRNAN